METGLEVMVRLKEPYYANPVLCPRGQASSKNQKQDVYLEI